MLSGHIILPEDNYKIIDAIKISEQQHFDPMTYDDPNEILAKYTIKEMRNKKDIINPDVYLTKISKKKAPVFSNKQTLDNGITIYDVQDTKAGQLGVRDIIDSHWGKDANPWCLAARHNDSFDGAWRIWGLYGGIPKRIAFANSKLVAFCANSRDKIIWWDE